MHAVYPTCRFLPAKLQVFRENLKTWKSPLWISAAMTRETASAVKARPNSYIRLMNNHAIDSCATLE